MTDLIGRITFRTDQALTMLDDYNSELTRLRAENARLREALKEILSEIPANPRLPLVWTIKNIAEAALKETDHE